MLEILEVYLVILWRGGQAVPTGSPLPLAAPARGERLLRQRVLEVLAAEAGCKERHHETWVLIGMNDAQLFASHRILCTE